MLNPVALQIGPISIYWYGIMYLLAFLTCFGLLAFRIKKCTYPIGFTIEQLSDIIFYAALGVVIGGRLGYMLFYDLDNFLSNPLRIFTIWKGGMSFHGGLIGVILALWFYAHRIKKSLIAIMDFIAPVVPLGLAFGRIGNFINGELWGRETNVPWAMIFPNGGDVPRHPSQLYEFFLEGLVLFAVLWLFSRKPKPPAAVSGLFLVTYGLFRFSVEFFREPDIQIGFVAFGWMTKGQLLSIPMIILGLGLLLLAYKGRKACSNT